MSGGLLITIDRGLAEAMIQLNQGYLNKQRIICRDDYSFTIAK